MNEKSYADEGKNMKNKWLGIDQSVPQDKKCKKKYSGKEKLEWKGLTPYRGEQVIVSAVSKGEQIAGEPKGVKIDFDFTKAQKATTLGAYIGPEVDEALENTWDTIGMWILGTEGVAGYWLRLALKEGDGQIRNLDLTGQQEGVNWMGWKYVEVKIPTTFSRPLSIPKENFVRLLCLNAGEGSPMRKGYFCVDAVQVQEGSSVIDVTPPRIKEIMINEEKVTSQQQTGQPLIIHGEEAVLGVSYDDWEGIYHATGINQSSLTVLLDGNVCKSECTWCEWLEVNEQTCQLKWKNLVQGWHKMTLSIQDLEGNETTTEVEWFQKSDSLPYIELDAPKEITFGNELPIKLNIHTKGHIQKVTCLFKLTPTWEVKAIRHNTQCKSSWHYDDRQCLLLLELEGLMEEPKAVGVTVELGITMPLENQTTLAYQMIATTVYGEDGVEGLPGGITRVKNVEITSHYTLKVHERMVGRSGVVQVVDSNDKGVQGAVLWLETGKKSEPLGVSDGYGFVRNKRLTQQPLQGMLYAIKQNYESFRKTIKVLKPLGSKKPIGIGLQAVNKPYCSKHITWLCHPIEAHPYAYVQLKQQETKEIQTFLGSFQEVAFEGEQDINANGIIRANNVYLEKLNPGTPYEYRVGDGTYWSEWYTFYTAQEKMRTTFIVLGDLQTRNLINLEAVLKQVEVDDKPLDCVLMVGDIIDEANKFEALNPVISAFDAVKWCHEVDFIRALGNHEYMGDSDAHIAKTLYRFPGKISNRQLEDTYSVDYGPLHIAVIGYTKTEEALQEKLKWLQEDMQANHQPWKVLLTHQPPFYTNEDGGNESVHQKFPPIIEQLGIQCVVSGHDHMYARTARIKSGKPHPEGTIYMVAGTLGQKFYNPSKSNWFEVVGETKQPIYLKGYATTHELCIEAVKPDGEIIDTYKIRR